MTIEEAKKFIKIDYLIFNKKTGQIVSLNSQWSDEFDYRDTERSLWVDNYNGLHVFPEYFTQIKVSELEDWEPATIEKLEQSLHAYCNFNAFRHLQLCRQLGNARLDF